MENEYQAPRGKVAESELFDTDERNTHPAPVMRKTIDVHEPRESNDPNFKDEGVDIREYAVEPFV